MSFYTDLDQARANQMGFDAIIEGDMIRGYTASVIDRQAREEKHFSSASITGLLDQFESTYGSRPKFVSSRMYWSY